MKNYSQLIEIARYPIDILKKNNKKISTEVYTLL